MLVYVYTFAYEESPCEAGITCTVCSEQFRGPGIAAPPSLSRARPLPGAPRVAGYTRRPYPES